MKLTMTAAITARWGHRVNGFIHTHAWRVEATVEGPTDAAIVMPVDDLERHLTEIVAPWHHHYLTHEDLGAWYDYEPIVWDCEPTIEEIARRVWAALAARVDRLVEVAVAESAEFDRCRTVRLAA